MLIVRILFGNDILHLSFCSFGMHHDGAGNDCDASNSKDIHMMSSLLTMDSTPMTWSRCSREYITKFFE